MQLSNCKSVWRELMDTGTLQPPCCQLRAPGGLLDWTRPDHRHFDELDQCDAPLSLLAFIGGAFQRWGAGSRWGMNHGCPSQLLFGGRELGPAITRQLVPPFGRLQPPTKQNGRQLSTFGRSLAIVSIHFPQFKVPNSTRRIVVWGKTRTPLRSRRRQQLPDHRQCRVIPGLSAH